MADGVHLGDNVLNRPAKVTSHGWVRASLVLLVGMTACTMASPSAEPQSSASLPVVSRKALIVVIQGEPGNLALPSMGDVPVGSTGGGDFKMAVHHRLATYDDRGAVHPQLAAALPSSESGTWRVRPDGTMQTTYRLRPGVSWHDGAPLTARDFVLGWTVTTDPDISVSGRFGAQIGRIDVPDELTPVFEWRQTYPFANAVVEDEMAPLPVHLLEATYQADKARFQQLGYWTREFVGTGPYRLSTWEPASRGGPATPLERSGEDSHRGAPRPAAVLQHPGHRISRRGDRR